MDKRQAAARDADATAPPRHRRVAALPDADVSALSGPNDYRSKAKACAPSSQLVRVGSDAQEEGAKSSAASSAGGQQAGLEN